MDTNGIYNLNGYEKIIFKIIKEVLNDLYLPSDGLYYRFDSYTSNYMRKLLLSQKEYDLLEQFLVENEFLKKSNNIIRILNIVFSNLIFSESKKRYKLTLNNPQSSIKKLEISIREHEKLKEFINNKYNKK